MQTSKKPRVNEQRTRAYAEALEQLLDLDRTSAPDDVFAALQTRGELGWRSGERAEGQRGSDKRMDKQGGCQHALLACSCDTHTKLTNFPPSPTLHSAEQVLAFLHWWAGDGPKPGIPGMQFNNTQKSSCALAVMDKATPGHGLTPHSRNGTWNERVTLVRQAAARVLCQLRQRWQNAGN